MCFLISMVRKVLSKTISFSISFIIILLKIVKKLLLLFTEKIRKKSLIEKVITFITLSTLLTFYSWVDQAFGRYRITGPDNSVDYFKLNEEWVWNEGGTTTYVIILSILSLMIFGRNKDDEKEKVGKEPLEEKPIEKDNTIDADFEVID
jgi:hypothetical protein